MSDKLLHFPCTDPPPKTEKQVEREELEKDVEAFLDAGGEVMVCDIEFRDEVKRTRRQQINYIRRRDFSLKGNSN